MPAPTSSHTRLHRRRSSPDACLWHTNWQLWKSRILSTRLQHSELSNIHLQDRRDLQFFFLKRMELLWEKNGWLFSGTYGRATSSCRRSPAVIPSTMWFLSTGRTARFLFGIEILDFRRLWYRLWNTKLSGLNFIHDCKGHYLVNRYLSLICFLMIGSWFNLIRVSVESRHLLFAQLKPWHKSVQGNMWICLSPQIGRASRWVGRNLWKTPIYHSDTHLIKFTCQKISYKPTQKFRFYSCP